MQEIVLPERFKKRLDSSDKKFNAIISEILSNFEQILNVSTLEFFPEYNNHGITHLNNVFKIQDELITDESFSLLTVEDIITLIIATLIHDIGMHLNYEGFQTLIIKDEKWKEKWDSFFHEARKYNETKLQSLFGDTAPVVELPKKEQDFRQRDKMLIGEFLRKNHPKLAEKIISEGFPFANGVFLNISSQLKNEEKILQFSALLAKSHGMSLRDTFKEIQNIGYEDNLVFAHNVHIVYLMVILRLSDYMDIYKNRHPKIILGLKNFMSNISKFEWDKNTSITDENPYHKDKEAIFLGVEPKDSITFINLKNLFKGIQYELDISWAVLGEVYSRDDKLKNLGIKYRRIRTNIDDEYSFSKKIDYIPKKISFDSDPEFLKLLIAPLYGDDPSYGVRELLQNAVDACKEYKELTSDESYKPKIYVNIIEKDDKYYFEIIDNGLGMTEETIINYFLKAGASFRNSDSWREKFEDDNHKSKVERTGRFGVGLLAAFLFGNKIEVKTRHYSSKIGYEFQTHLSDNQINVMKNNGLDMGTSIKIEMNKEAFNKLIYRNNYDLYDGVPWTEWYLLNDIEIFYNNKVISKVLDEQNYIELKQNEFSSVKWSYENQSNQLCVCNGFQIPSGTIRIKSTIDFPATTNNYYKPNKFNTPSFLITDKEGKLPLSLDRERFLKEEFGFDDVLIKSMADKLFKSYLDTEIYNDKLMNHLSLKHPIISNNISTNFIFSQEGFNLFHSFTLEKNKIDRLIFIEFNEHLFNKVMRTEFLNSLIEKNVYVVSNEGRINSPSGGYNYLLHELSMESVEIDKRFAINSANIIIPKDKHSKVFTYKNTTVKVGLKDNILTSNQEIKNKKGVLPFNEESKELVKYYFKKKEESIFDLNDLDKYIDDIGLIVEMYIDYQNPEKRDIEYYFSSLMEEYFKDKESYWLPYKK